MLDQFSRQNRWWEDPTEVERDRHLRRLREATLRWEPSLPFQFERDSIYTLRGPRQVGKSTVLKRQIAQLISTGWTARRVLYLDIELAGLATPRELIASLREYLDAQRVASSSVEPERLAIFLDEVTRIDGWAGAIRGLVDNDELRGVTLIATGSHSTDLRKGGERMPGRRGGGRELDLELQPLSFREYVQVVLPATSLPETVSTFTPDTLRPSYRDRTLIRARLEPLFERYLLVGGFLSALNDVARVGATSPETFQTHRESISGELNRAGLRETYLRELIDWLATHLGQEFDYRGIAADTDIGSKDTARLYLDHMIETYTALITYRTTSLTRPAPAFRSPRKIHPIDPLLWHLIRAWGTSDPDPWRSALETMMRSDEVGHVVESVLAVHLRRAFGDRVFFWRTGMGRELDFVIAPAGPRPENAAPALVEVKYQRQVSERDARVLAAEGGGVLVSRSLDTDLADGAVYCIPAADALILLDAPALAPARH
ncbi:MAG: ATP-binding protein [Chloroflexota bacterium]